MVRMVGVRAQGFEVNYVFVEPRSGTILGATSHERLRIDFPPKFRGALSSESRGSMMRIVGAGGQGFGVTCVFVEPLSGSILGAVVHEQVRFDSSLQLRGARGYYFRWGGCILGFKIYGGLRSNVSFCFRSTRS